MGFSSYEYNQFIAIKPLRSVRAWPYIHSYPVLPSEKSKNDIILGPPNKNSKVYIHIEDRKEKYPTEPVLVVYG